MNRALALLFLACGIGVMGLAQEGSELSGTLGVELTFMPVSPASLNVDTAITSSLSFAGASVDSRTVISLDGLESEHMRCSVKLDDVTLATGMRFDPCFSRYWFEVDLGLTFEPGFFVRSITGFGVKDLYNLIDEYPQTDVTAVSGWWFSEELINVGFASECLRTESLFSFDELGFAWAQLHASYTWVEPAVQLGARLWIDSAFAFSRADLILRVTIDPVELRSVTSFDSLGFLSQEIDISTTLSGVKLYSRTSFDFTGLQSEVIGFVLSF